MEAKDWVFIFPIIAAIILLISLIFPLIGISIFYTGIIDPAITLDLMPFGGILDELDPYIASVPQAEGLRNIFLYISIVFAIPFILDALLLIISGIRVKTGSEELKKARKKWLRKGLKSFIIELILFFILAIGIPIALEQTATGLEMGFIMRTGMILIIVAGGVLILAYILTKKADKLMVRVFISHSTKDFNLVDMLRRYLEACGIKVYIAERDIQPGTQLSQKIEQNIKNSDYFLVVYTKNGKESGFVREEIGFWKGRRNNKNLVPFVEKGINPGAFLCGVEYIEFDPLNPNVGFVRVKKYIEQQRKIERGQLIVGVGVGLGLVGIISLVLYGLSKLDDEE